MSCVEEKLLTAQEQKFVAEEMSVDDKAIAGAAAIKFKANRLMKGGRLPVASAEEMAQYQVVFSKFDADGGGQIDSSELKAVLEAMGKYKTADEIEQMLRKADTDGDGTVNFSEFVALMGRRIQSDGADDDDAEYEGEEYEGEEDKDA